MGNKLLILMLGLIFLAPIVYAEAIPSTNPCDFRGYINYSDNYVYSSTLPNLHAYVGGSLDSNAVTIISNVSGKRAYAVTTSQSGAVEIKLFGVTKVSQTCSAFQYFENVSTNITYASLGSGATCSYSAACSSGYLCCSGTNEINSISSSGACTSGASCSGGGGGDGGGGGGGGGGGSGSTSSDSTVTTTLTGVAGSTSVIAINNAGIGVTLLSIGFTSTVSNGEVTVMGSVPATTINSAVGILIGATYQYLKINTQNIDASTISQVSISFKVTKAWIASKGITSADINLFRYIGTQWVKLPTTKTSEDSTYVYYTATSPGLSYFAVGTDKIIEVLPAEAITPAQNVSQPSEPGTEPVVPGETPVTPPEQPPVEPVKPAAKSLTWLWALLGVVIVILLVALVLMLKPKKPRAHEHHLPESEHHSAEHHDHKREELKK